MKSQSRPQDARAIQRAAQSGVYEAGLGSANEPAQRAARVLVDALVTAGVDTFFGIPGGPAVTSASTSTRAARCAGSFADRRPAS